MRINLENTFIYILQVNFKKAYSEESAALLFKISDGLKKICSRFYKKNSRIQEGIDSSNHFPLHEMPDMEQVLESIWRVSKQKCPVLLIGETGTGKELIANTIRNGSARYHEAYVKINCGSIPETLIDSYLFGYEKGAFTGANELFKGSFERAHKGILLLDEMGELPLQVQARLLRVLQEKTIVRVGGVKEIEVDVRIIAATHRNLGEMVKKAQFREDLFYRLNVFPIHIPPLRKRPRDLLLLLKHFISTKCQKEGIQTPEISSDELKKIQNYPWPGNIRELQNLVERALILHGSKNQNKLSFSFGEDFFTEQSPVQNSTNTQVSYSTDLSLDAVIENHIKNVLITTNGKIKGRGGAAEVLNINASTLRSKMKKYNLA